MTYILVWVVATITAQGPHMQNIKDPTPPMSEKVCKEFGEAYKSRMEDWVRGAMQAHWDHPVRVEYACTPDGQPA